jgi:hypothetical protein
MLKKLILTASLVVFITFSYSCKLSSVPAISPTSTTQLSTTLIAPTTSTPTPNVTLASASPTSSVTVNATLPGLGSCMTPIDGATNVEIAPVFTGVVSPPQQATISSWLPIRLSLTF